MGDSEVHALRHVSLDVYPGELVSIIGPSGSGKSTLLQIMGCLDHVTTGKVYVDGKDTCYMPDAELSKLRNRKLGFIFQSFNMMLNETVLANVEVPLQDEGFSHKERRRLAADALRAVGLDESARLRPSELPGGDRQRVAIARAIVNRPPAILADEPTGTLDSESGRGVMAVLEDLNANGYTIILATCRPDVAAFARRTITISNGTVSESRPSHGPPPGFESITAAPAPGAAAPRRNFRVCLRCGADNRPTTSYCRSCGFPLDQTDYGLRNVRARLLGETVACRGCGADNRPVARFCSNCGLEMDTMYSGT